MCTVFTLTVFSIERMKANESHTMTNKERKRMEQAKPNCDYIRTLHIGHILTVLYIKMINGRVYLTCGSSFNYFKHELCINTIYAFSSNCLAPFFSLPLNCSFSFVNHQNKTQTHSTTQSQSQRSDGFRRFYFFSLSTSFGYVTFSSTVI